jgi:hypothetical protein
MSVAHLQLCLQDENLAKQSMAAMVSHAAFRALCILEV